MEAVQLLQRKPIIMTKKKSKVLKRMPTANSRTNKAKLWHDESVIRKLYEQDSRTQKQIATELGCSMLTISKAFKKFGIKAKRGRPVAKGRRSSDTGQSHRTVTVSRGGINSDSFKNRFLELTSLMDRLGPHGKVGVKKDLHELVDRL